MDAVLGLVDTYGLDDPMYAETVGLSENRELQTVYDDLVSMGSESIEAALEADASHSAAPTPVSFCGTGVHASECERHDGSHGEPDADGLNDSRTLMEDDDRRQRREDGVQGRQDRVDTEGTVLERDRDRDVGRHVEASQ
jgi:hypothetical protein